MDFAFSENGLVGLKNGQAFHNKSIKDELGEAKLKKIINFCLLYIGNLDIPIKRGTFIEYRTGMLNISPIGRNCSRDERNAYEVYDKEHKIRETFIKALKEEFKEDKLQYSIGGQISFDVFPKGWDKTYCLQFLQGYDEIHFFGDKTFEGGNDHEIFMDERTIGHTVKDPQDTISQLKQLFNLD